jgi:Tfp pilus assembly protein PilE
MKIIHKTAGLTLVETIVILFIFLILVCIAIPKVQDNSVKKKCEEIPQVLMTFEHAQITHLAETGTLATKLSDLPCSIPHSKWFTYQMQGGDKAPATMIATVAPGVKLGRYKPGFGHASTTITISGTVTRSRGEFAQRHLPTFK